MGQGEGREETNDIEQTRSRDEILVVVLFNGKIGNCIGFGKAGEC